MKPSPTVRRWFAVFASVVWASLMIGCGSSTPLSGKRQDGGLPGSGGTTGTGGMSAGGNHADGSLGNGGSSGGGAIGSGGAPGGSTGTLCGTTAVLGCPTGQFCDLASNCGTIDDAAGVCVTTDPNISCPATYAPVCGCNGKTYPNDCARKVEGVLKASDGACSSGTGGKTSLGGANGGVGGKTGSGGMTGTGAKTGAGGLFVDGGAPGSGGRTGSGGATGSGGDNSCGGPTGITCPAGQFCDLASNCGKIADATGFCMAVGWNVPCSTTASPVCGCEGRTYSNNCERAKTGMLKAANGVCNGGPTSYPTAYLVWQAAVGDAGTGPAVVVSAADGWIHTWDNTSGFSPESPPASPTSAQTLTLEQTDSLLIRLSGMNTSKLPHSPTISHECSATLYYRLCKGCATITLKYDGPQQISPEIDSLWSWFDDLIGATASTNPHNYCK